MLNKKMYSVVLVIVVMLVSLSIVSFSKEVTLEFIQWWEDELPEGALRGICDDFTKETGIKIKLLSNPYTDTKTQIIAGTATGTVADVVGICSTWVYDFAKMGAIENLSDLMTTFGYDDSQIASQIQIDGSTYSIPIANFAYPMFVNKDILESVGIRETPENWTDFRMALETVSKENNNIYGWIIPLSLSAPNGITKYLGLAWGSGARMLEDGKPNLVNNEKLIKTAEFVKYMFENELVTPGAYAMKEPDMVEEFANGRVAFMISSLAHIQLIKEASPDMNLGIMGIPKMDNYSGKSGIHVANWGIGISSSTEYKEEAMKFIEYLLSPEINGKLAVYANAFPNNTVANPDYTNADPLFLDAYDIVKKDCYVMNEFAGLPVATELMRQLAEQFQLYLEGDVSVEGMLYNTQKQWEKAFK